MNGGPAGRVGQDQIGTQSVRKQAAGTLGRKLKANCRAGHRPSRFVGHFHGEGVDNVPARRMHRPLAIQDFDLQNGDLGYRHTWQQR